MTELQSKLSDMLRFFHDLCEKENLRYYLQGRSTKSAKLWVLTIAFTLPITTARGGRGSSRGANV